MKTLKVAFIGCGGMAAIHGRTLAADSRVQITALVDPSAEKLAKFRERVPQVAECPAHDDYRAVLADADAVVIASPHTLHFPQVMDALNAGLHVLVEKPMVCTVAHARQVVKKVRETRLKLQIAYQRKATPVFQYIRETIASGGIGRLQFITVMLHQEWLVATRGSWRQDPQLSGGGQLNDSGSHIMNMLTWLPVQRPASVVAFSDNRGAKVDIDTAVAIRYSKGALATVSIVATAPRWDERWFIVGSKGALTYDNGTLRRIDGLRGEPTEVQLPKVEGWPITTNWVDAIFGKARLIAPASCGLDVISLTEAIWKSAAKGGRPTACPAR